MSVRTYKFVKALIQLLAVAAGIYALSLDADPTLTFVVIGAIVVGPEVMELLIVGDGVTIHVDDEGP
ncbi:MAG: hypothetical protein ACOCR0_02050 [Haloferacaceae archaeon]